MASNTNALKEQAIDALDRMQTFDVNSLPQKEKLGEVLCFDNAVAPATVLINFYKKLSISALDDFPDNYLQKVKDQATGDYGLFHNILSFDPSTQSKNERDALVSRLTSRYNDLFVELHGLISYSMHKATDFAGLETNARRLFQDIRDRSDQQQQQIDNINESASIMLKQIESIAAEQGVTQQAIYFKKEAKDHEAESRRWLRYTIYSGAVVIIYAIALFVLSYLSLPNITDNYQAIMFTTSKLLLFFVFSYGLYFFARNYFSHKHNFIINRHRQNALVTYRAIVNAASNSANTDIILNQVSACIFSPQETGFSSYKTPSSIPTSGPMNYLIKESLELK